MKFLSKSNIKQAKGLLKEMVIEYPRLEKLKEYISLYMDGLKALLPKQRKIICTSDIIESAFGKYKNYISNNPMVGITNLSLTMSAFTCDLKIEEIRSSFEKVKGKEVKGWTERNIGTTNMQLRKQGEKKI